MTINESIEVFTTEYRHNTVEKFVKDIVDEHISLALPSNSNSEIETMIATLYHSFIENIVKYTSCEDKENQIFSDILMLRIYDIVIEKNKTKKNRCK